MSQSNQSPGQKKRNSQLKLMGILVAVIVLLNAVVLFLVLSNKDKKDVPIAVDTISTTKSKTTPSEVPGTDTVYVQVPQQTNERTAAPGGHLPGKYPEASLRDLNMSDIRGMHVWDVVVMRNEIYARYGYRFKISRELKDYFESQSWYQARNESVDYMLTPLEKRNVEFLVRHTPNYDPNNIRGSNTYVR